MTTKRTPKILLSLCLIASVASALGATAEAKKGKPKDNHIEDLIVTMVGDVEEPYMSVAAMPFVDSGKKVKVTYLEDDGTGEFVVLGMQKEKVTEDGYAYFNFTTLSAQELCLLKVKQPGGKKVKPAKFETGFNCATGELSAG